MVDFQEVELKSNEVYGMRQETVTFSNLHGNENLILDASQNVYETLVDS